MKPSDEDRFVKEWKQWLEQPLATPPARAAARISSLLEARRRSRLLRWAPAFAAAAVLIAGIFLSRGIGPERPRSEAVGEWKAPALKEGEVLLWLDRSTPLYMTFSPPAKETSRRDKS